MHAVTLIPGDGIGPEIAEATLSVVEAAGARLRWETAIAGAVAAREQGDPLPQATVASIRRTGVALKGPTATSTALSHRRVGASLRQELGLFATLRIAESLSGVPARGGDVDVLVFSEVAQGFVSGLEHAIDRNSAESIAVLTREGCARFLHFVFTEARARGRRRVTLVHRSPTLRLTSELFLEVARAEARHFPRLVFDELSAAQCCEQLVRDPARFDVVVAHDLFCSSAADLASGLVGGFAVTPSVSYGQGVALFEVTHGPATDLVGRGAANPAALMLAACEMLGHVGLKAAAARLRNAVRLTLRHKRLRTADLGGTGSTSVFTNHVIRALERG
jgi:isocitrate dehydrogenase (NAD+)